MVKKKTKSKQPLIKIGDTIKIEHKRFCWEGLWIGILLYPFILIALVNAAIIRFVFEIFVAIIPYLNLNRINGWSDIDKKNNIKYNWLIGMVNINKDIWFDDIEKEVKVKELVKRK